MAKIFLRSGSMDTVLALGENGQPVYFSTLQLRETLRLRKQSQVANCLAISQLNDAGDRLDWYSPVVGKVTSWAAASNSVRNAALTQLRSCQQTVAVIGEQARKSGKPGLKLFGALLEKALYFPDQNYVYLVGGQPVITFWGFVSLEKKSRQDPLTCLSLAVADEPQPDLSRQVPLTAAVPPVPEPATRVVPVIPPLEISGKAAEPDAQRVSFIAAEQAPRHWSRYRWALPLLVLGMTLAVPMKNGNSPVTERLPQSIVAPQLVAQPVVRQAPITLPLSPATLLVVKPAAVPTQEPEVAAAVAVDELNIPPAGKDDLVLPADAVKIGSITFLNGDWQALVQLKTPLVGAPPLLTYQLRNGKGSGNIARSDGVSCWGNVFAGLMKSGNLVISSRSKKAQCSDGSRYQMPELICKQKRIGAAVCTIRYKNGMVLPMTMKREDRS